MRLIFKLLILFVFICFPAFAEEGQEPDWKTSVKETFETLKKEEVLDHFKNAYEKQSNATPTQRAEFYYQNEVNLKPEGCNDCPEYLNLIREVNSIIEKLPEPLDTKLANEQIIQLDRLKFMYIESVSASMGNEVCSILNNSDPLQPLGIEKDKLTPIFEELTSLPNITSVQFYPMPPEKERRYFYRGEGLQSHVIVEVVVKDDQTAKIRYHHYNPYNLPNLKSAEKNLWDVFNKQGTLGDTLTIKSKADIHLAEQNLRIGVTSRSGRDWLQIEGTHATQSEAKFKVIIPMEINLSDNKNVKLTGQVSHEQRQDLNTADRDLINKAEIKLSNKDKGYISGKVEKNDEVEEVRIGTSYQFNVGDKINIDANAEQLDLTQEEIEKRNQNLSISLKDTKGNHEYITAQVSKEITEDQTQEKIAFSTKHQWELDSDRGLKIRGEASGSTLIVNDDLNSTRTNEMLLSLTDHNHEYVTAKVVRGNVLDDLMSLSSGYKVGEYGSVRGTFEQYESGKEAFSIGHQMGRGKNTFETSVGHDSEAGNYFSFKVERKISSTSSMVLTVKTDANDERTVLYQYQSKF